MQPTPGAKVNDELKLLEPLAEGAIGTVWVAEQRGLAQRVAVKFVSAEGELADPESRERLATEARAASEIDSEHIVRVLSHGTTDDGTPFIAMELLSGESLGDRVRKSGPLPPRELGEVVRQAASALAASHRAGIVHRDVKPDNLFLSTDDRGGLVVKVLDFGFAKAMTKASAKTRKAKGRALTAPGMMVGTPKFISSDQLLDPLRVDPQRDLWALSVTAYFALTGAHPFESNDMGELFQKILRGTFTPPCQLRPELPATLDAWFARAFARDKRARFDDAADLVATLAHALGVARPPSNPAPSTPAPSSPEPSSDSEEAGLVARPDGTSFNALLSPEAIIEVCSHELTLTEDRAHAARLHFEIARQCEWAADIERALEHYRTALERMPQHLPSLRGARRCLLVLKSPDVAALYDDEIRLTPAALDKAELYLAKGRALELSDRDAEACDAAFAKAAELSPASPRVLWTLMRRAAYRHSWAELGPLCSRTADVLSSDDPLRAALLSRRAMLSEHRLGDERAAIELYGDALRIDGGTLGARHALERLLDGQQGWSALAESLERALEASDEPLERATLLLRIARIQSVHLGARASAGARLAEASQLQPTDRLALDELERLADRNGDRALSTDVWARKVALAESTAERFDLMQRLGDLHGEDDPEESAAWYESALANEPSSETAVRALERLYRRTKDWRALVAAYVAHAEALDGATRAHVEALAAELLACELGDLESAIRHYERALGLDPERIDCFHALLGLLGRVGRFPEMVERLENAVERASDPRLSVCHVLRIGAIQQHELSDPRAAARTYRRALGSDGGDLAAILALRSAAEDAGDGELLVEALQLEAKTTRSDRDRLALWHWIGRICAARGDVANARARFEAVLAEDPSHIPALASLEALYESHGPFDELARALERRLRATTDATVRARLSYRLGSLADLHLDDPDEAIRHLQRALVDLPGYAPALRALLRILAHKGDHRARVELLREARQTSASKETRALLSYLIGDIFASELSSPKDAALAYRQAVSDAEQPLLLRVASSALVRAVASMGDKEALVAALVAEARSLGPRDGAAALFDAAHVGAASGATIERAIAAYEAAATAAPGDIAVLLALEPLYREAHDWQGLTRVVAGLAHKLDDQRLRVAALEELAPAQELAAAGAVALGDTYRRILSSDPQSRAALDGLERLGMERGDRSYLIEADRALLAVTRDRTLAAAHGTRLAASLWGVSPADAVEDFSLALEREPDNLAAMRGLRGAAIASGAPELEATAIRLEAAWTKDSAHAAELFVAAARVSIEHRLDAATALEDLENALRSAPDHAQAAERIEPLMIATGEIDRLLERLALAARTAARVERQLALWQAVARVRHAHKGDVPGAVAALERCRQIAPQDLPTLLSLSERYEENAQWRAAADVLTELMPLLPSDEERAPHRVRLARLLARRLGRATDALSVLEDALATDADSPRALELLVELSSQAGDHTGAHDAAVRWLAASHEHAERARALTAIGRAELALGRREPATEALRRAVALGGARSGAHAELIRLTPKDAAMKMLVDALYEHLVAVAKGDLESVDETPSRLELARLLEHELERTRDALALLRAGLDRAPDGGAFALAYTETALRAGLQDEALGEIGRRLRATPSTAELWRALALCLCAQGREAEAALGLEPVLWLGAADDAERALSARWRREPGWSRAGAIDAVWIASLSAAPNEAPLIALLAAIDEALPTLMPLDLGRWGAAAIDAETASHPLYSAAMRVAAAFGIDEIELHLHDLGGFRAELHPSRVPLLLAPRTLSKEPLVRQVLVLARAFVHHARGLMPSLCLDADELERWIAAAVSTEIAELAETYDDADLLPLGRRIVKALPRRRRRALGQAAADIAAEPGAIRSAELRRWAAQAEQTATRVAAILCGDLGACIETVRAADPSLEAVPRVELAARTPVVADLLRFWMSEPALQLRRHMGLLG